MKLREVLEELTREELERVVREAGLTVPAANGGTGLALINLANERLGATERVKLLFGNCTPNEARILSVAVEQGGQLTVSELGRLVPEIAMEACRDELARLGKKALVFTPERFLAEMGEAVAVVPSNYFTHVRKNGNGTPSLGFCLLQFRGADFLRMMAAHLGVPVNGGPKTSVAFAIKRHLLDETRLQALLDRLTIRERQVLEHLVKHGGGGDYYELVKRFGNVAARGNGAERDMRELTSLEAKGLLFEDRRTGALRYVIPSDLAGPVGAYLEDSRKDEVRKLNRLLKEANPAPPVVRSNDECLLRDLRQLVGRMSGKRMRATARGDVPRTELRKIAKLFAVEKESPLYPSFVMALAIGLGLAREQGGSLAVSPTANEWLERGEAAWRDIVLHWTKTSSWVETCHKRLTIGERAWVGSGDIVRIRQKVFEALRSCPADRWVTMPFFQGLVRLRGLSPHIGWVETGGARPVQVRDPEQALDLLVNRFLKESLYWLGIVNIGYGDPGAQPIPESDLRGAPLYFRVTEQGARFLGKTSDEDGTAVEEGPSPRETQFTLTPNLEVIASPFLEFRVFQELNQFAEPLGEGRFRLTRESVREHLDRGKTVEQLVAYLAEHSKMEVPDTVQRLLEDVGRKHGHIKMGFVGPYLRVEDPSLIDELKANKRFAKFIDRCVLPGFIALKTADPEALLKELRKAGYMPIWEGGPMLARDRGTGTAYGEETRSRRRGRRGE